MRQMPAGQWVPFEDDTPHKCAAPPKAKSARKPSQRTPLPPPAPPTDDDFGVFVLPNDNAASGTKPPIAGSDIIKAPAPPPPIQPAAPKPATPLRLTLSSPIAVSPPHPKLAQAPIPRAELIGPVPPAANHGFRQWLLRALAFLLILGLVKAVLREATRPNLPRIDPPSSTVRDAPRIPASPASSSPSIKILQTRPISYPQTATAPPVPTPPGNPAAGYPPWLNRITIPPSNRP
jgi:hypothetical protein